ncbi:hypothetical protein SLH46_13800 [Draconibacterium sp. IB214405]|uniref:M61 family metallopeptidase n=1 Tax=Draconibacterium sp. IB214405 TaxID=3097352 RepID=UPI002A0AF9B7|nr:hypothetical protein [Draconibacterium sp. IB214405]MDX8340269.1 hypothetical protein [Draconibacterium sp. IB214405]
MKNMRALSISFLLILTLIQLSAGAQSKFSYTISIPDPSSESYQVEMTISDVNSESLVLKMPKWMPGYYQIMDYAKDVRDLTAKNGNGESLTVSQLNDNTWEVASGSVEQVKVSYTVEAKRAFVAVSKVDEEHAYIAPCNTYLYVDGMLNNPAEVNVILPSQWKDVATGLHPVKGTSSKFKAENFDFLYDCPILIGNLEELPAFEVHGIEHRFIGYKVGEFDKVGFMAKLQKSVEAAVELMGDIPYKHYTFLAIGPGMGGIEHLNSTTISFDGNNLRSHEAENRILSFITHEYFHHYNVKRIRPVELGPFDYDRENRTTQLWVSEGLTVYYEYVVLKEAGLLTSDEFMQAYSNEITAAENDPGKEYQSLTESSFRTWDEGPFGITAGEDHSISYYVKGPVAGLLLDFAIRHNSNNKQSLDDVMRYLYNHFYKELGRGFTDAEVQQACEVAAGAKLDEVFEYITTTRPLDYKKYLGYAGLKLAEHKNEKGNTSYKLERLDDVSEEQQTILQSWLRE